MTILLNKVFSPFVVLSVMLLSLVSNVALAQVDEVYPCSNLPYNPDVDCNGLINFEDLINFLPLFGEAFTPDLLELLDEDIDVTNELQWLLLSNDTLYLLLPDSSVYNSVFIGGADGLDGSDGLSAFELWLEAGNNGDLAAFLALTTNFGNWHLFAAREVFGCNRITVFFDVFWRAFANNLAAMDSGTGADVDKVVRRHDSVLVVLNDYDRIADIPQTPQRD